MHDVLSNANLPTGLYDAVWRELMPTSGGSQAGSARETVLWVGQPDPQRMTRAGLPVLFFGVPWTLFSLFWMAMAFRTSGVLFGLFGLPFVMIGGVMLAAPVFAAEKPGKPPM